MPAVWGGDLMSVGSINRCPYCAENDQFKIMSVRADGNCQQCTKCGHVISPNDPLFVCTCRKCKDLTAR